MFKLVLENITEGPKELFSKGPLGYPLKNFFILIFIGRCVILSFILFFIEKSATFCADS